MQRFNPQRLVKRAVVESSKNNVILGIRTIHRIGVIHSNTHTLQYVLNKQEEHGDQYQA